MWTATFSVSFAKSHSYLYTATSLAMGRTERQVTHISSLNHHKYPLRRALALFLQMKTGRREHIARTAGLARPLS